MTSIRIGQDGCPLHGWTPIVWKRDRLSVVIAMKWCKRSAARKAVTWLVLSCLGMSLGIGSGVHLATHRGDSCCTSCAAVSCPCGQADCADRVSTTVGGGSADRADGHCLFCHFLESAKPLPTIHEAPARNCDIAQFILWHRVCSPTSVSLDLHLARGPPANL